MIARPENVLIHGQHLNTASANCADGVDADETAGLDLNADESIHLFAHNSPAVSANAALSLRHETVSTRGSPAGTASTSIRWPR